MKVSKQRYAGLLVKSFLLGTLAIAVSISPALQNEAQADKEIVIVVNVCPRCGFHIDACHCVPGIRKNTRSDYGMYKDRGKSSPKIAHGMYRNRGKSVSGRRGDSNSDGSVNISDPSRSRSGARGKPVSGRRGDPDDNGAVQLTDGIRKSNGRFNSKFSQRTLQFQRNLVLDQIEMAVELGEFEMAQDLLEDLYQLNRVGR